MYVCIDNLWAVRQTDRDWQVFFFFNLSTCYMPVPSEEGTDYRETLSSSQKAIQVSPA